MGGVATILSIARFSSFYPTLFLSLFIAVGMKWGAMGSASAVIKFEIIFSPSCTFQRLMI
jgi:hypothetical protein